MMKKSFQVIVLAMAFLVLFTGCGKKKEKEVETGPKVVEITRVADFADGIAVVSNGNNYYVIDRDLKVLFQNNRKLTYVGGYALIDDPENRKKHSIINSKGEEVFSYTDSDYQKITLVENGCMITERRDDNWDSSKMVYGIYNLSEKKYVLEESPDNYSKMVSFGENMIQLNEEGTKFFNTQTNQTVTYKVKVVNPFQDGYSTSLYTDSKNQNYLDIFKDDGQYQRVSIPFGDTEDSLKTRTGKYAFLQSCTEANVCQSMIVDLETKEVINLKSQYHQVQNDVTFTEEGYALLVFTNEGGTYYYTVIDGKGNQQFEPVKSTPENRYLSTYDAKAPQIVDGRFYEGNYMISYQEGTYRLLDKDNKEVTVASEYETFEGITNGYIKVKAKEPGRAIRYYYKDLKGELAQVTEDVK